MGGTQPVRMIRPISPGAPSGPRTSSKPSSSPPARNPTAPSALPADSSQQERDVPQPNEQNSFDEPKGNLVPHPAGYYVPPAVAASISQHVRAHEGIAARSAAASNPALSAAMSGAISAHPANVPPPPGSAPSALSTGPQVGSHIIDEPSSTPGNSAEFATQVYRPRNTAELQRIRSDPRVRTSPAPKQPSSSPWAFLVGAIAFLLVGFCVVALIMRYLTPLP
jgi:hypothetical protein